MQSIKKIGIAAVALSLAGTVAGASAWADDTDQGPTAGAESTVMAPPAPSGAVLWAVVGPTGDIAKGYRVTSSDHQAGTGLYRVKFNRSIQGCAYQATVSATSPDGFTATGVNLQQPRTVLVYTSDVSANPTERAFHLTVTC